MNENFRSLIENSRAIACAENLNWDIAIDINGVADEGQGWDLRILSKDGQPSPRILRTFSEFEDAQAELVARGLLNSNDIGPRPVSGHWQNLIKAHALDHIVVKRKSLSFAQSASQAWRFLATVARKEPWLVTVDDVRLACQISDVCQSTDSRTINIMALTRNFVDVLHIFDACPLAALVNRPQPAKNNRAKYSKTARELPTKLAQRKAQEKLPDSKAFWELLNIVYTKTPASVVDYLRFAIVKIMLLTGLRIGEVVTIPVDWKRTRGYVDGKGRPAGESGGISESLSIRHFAEKQGEAYFLEAAQFVPNLFRDEIEKIFEGVIALTTPLRATLKAQFESGRIFPQYRPDQLVSAVQMYTHLTGNPIWTHPPYSAELTQCLSQYRATFSLSELARLPDLQRSTTRLSAAVSRYFTKARRSQGLVLREANGSPCIGTGVSGKYLYVSDVEAYLNNHAEKKPSDLTPLQLNDGGKLSPWEMLFLMPKCAVAEGRGDSAIDLFNTFSVGIADQALVLNVLGRKTGAKKYTIFNTYGLTADDRVLALKTHEFRHLQNTELFRLGITDSVISKRFNRKSVAQNRDYDHRSLAENLDEIELPDEWAQVLGESKAATVAKMILANKANGPIVREFKRIQKAEGDYSALLFLLVEADGFHITPYGVCLNSFTVDPCPNHLECFNNCRHLSSTGLPEHKKNLVVLLGRLKIALEHAQSKPDDAIGKANQVAHAMTRVEGAGKLLATPVGELAFPDGVDLSKPKNQGSIFDVS